MADKELEQKLIVGSKIKIGEKYSAWNGFRQGEIITLVQGEFEYENGLYTEAQCAPSIWCEDRSEFDSIYHLFGNDLEEFQDCEVVFVPPMADKGSFQFPMHRPVSENDWPEDFKHDNGNYNNTCLRCEAKFVGHKRRVLCKVCDNPQLTGE